MLQYFSCHRIKKHVRMMPCLSALITKQVNRLNVVNK